MWDGDRGILHQEFQSSCCCQGQLWEINRSYLIHELSLFEDEGGYLVVYHKDISEGIEVYKDFPGSPVLRVAGMQFTLTEEPMSLSDFRFEDYSADFDEDEFDEELYDAFCGAGSKILGYPFFTQYDPRNDEEHDVLLFQLDSEEGFVMWGDCGVANFFINADALKRMDFSDVLYNWDWC